MDLLGAVGVEELHRLPQLGAPDDAVIHKEELFALDELVDGDLLHFSHPIPLLLVGGHEAAGPGGGVFDKGAGKGDAALVGIADGVGGAGIRNAADIVNVLGGAVFLVGLGQQGAVAVAHDLHVDPLIVGVGVAIIGPQEGTHPHLLLRRQEGLPPGLGDLYHLCRAQLVGVVVAHLLVGEGLKGHAAALVILADVDG